MKDVLPLKTRIELQDQMAGGEETKAPKINIPSNFKAFQEERRELKVSSHN